MFIDDVTQDAAKGVSFNDKAFLEKVTNFEWNWTKQDFSQSGNSNEDALLICKKLITKYESKILSVGRMK